MTAYLVFFMQPGFAMVEAGLTRARNACNILAKNLLDFCIASIIFFLVGYGFMFGDGNSFIGLTGFALNGLAPTTCPLGHLDVPGGLLRHRGHHHLRGHGQRTKFTSYLLATLLMTGIVYPIIGHWTWAADGCPRWASLTSPAPPSCTAPAAGPP